MYVETIYLAISIGVCHGALLYYLKCNTLLSAQCNQYRVYCRVGLMTASSEHSQLYHNNGNATLAGIAAHLLYAACNS